MTASGDRVFPLIPSRRRGTLDVAGRSSRRRGGGDEVAGTRPYRHGDPIRSVDWAASARLSTARGSDEFVVRDHFADDAVRVVLVVDRSSSMGLFPRGLPLLDKRAAVREAGDLIVASGLAANALIGLVAVGEEGTTLVPGRRDRAQARAIGELLVPEVVAGPVDSVDNALDALLRRTGIVPPGTFVFLLSDFLPPPASSRLHLALAAGWDVVPVVIQDPVWERSFPDVAGVTLPLVDPDDLSPALVRLSRKQSTARRALNEQRAKRLRATLLGLGLDPVTISSSARSHVHHAFLEWADMRQQRLRAAR